MQHPGAHDTTLVVLSVLIATLASYTALDLANRMRSSSGWPCRAWLGSAAVAMGGGIWSMHFVAMLAFSLPGMEVSYDLGLTLASLALAVAVTAIGFSMMNRASVSLGGLALSGLIVGLGIAAMHYAGMSAMRMQADLRHDHLWVAISILIAIGAATAALWLSYRHTGFAERLAASIVMGVAISGMHYAAMVGAAFMPHAGVVHTVGQASIGQTILAVWVAGTTFLILVLALIAAMVDRRLARLAEREALTLRESEEKFRVLVQAVTDYALYMLDPLGRVVNWNTGAQRLKGYTEREIVGHHFSRFYTDEDRTSGLPERALATAATQGRFENQGWRVRKDGTRFWADVVLDPIYDEQKNLIGFAKITRDVTERRAAQQALEEARVHLLQSQKMDALGQLTGGVAHDFNNLLAVVLGNLELARKQLPDNPKLRQHIENSMQAAQRGATLTKRLLAFSRQQNLRAEVVDVPELVQGMADLLQRSIGPAIQINTRFPLRVDRAYADPNQLELALLNLVVNARDAMPQGGEITISMRNESVPANREGLAAGDYVCLSVADAGQGMDEATLARCIDPFFTTKGVGKGTGLGLSMIHGFAQQSNGRLMLKSVAGQGTTAEIWLPMAASDPTLAAKSEAPAASVPAIARRLSVLIVDDDSLVLANTSALVDDLGHDVLEATSGEQALRILSRFKAVDLVITDQLMPGMSGTELIAKIRSEWPGLPVVLGTGYGEIIESGVNAHRIAKPFTQAELARSIADAVQPEEESRVLPFRPR